MQLWISFARNSEFNFSITHIKYNLNRYYHQKLEYAPEFDSGIKENEQNIHIRGQ